MPQPYDEQIAQHYAAFRPNLHGVILSRALGPVPDQAHGLDLGCGTGASALALAEHCAGVTAIDTSPAMLAQAQSHPHIRYQPTRGQTLAFASQSFDLITLAGVWPYAQSQTLLHEVIRVARPGAQVLLYDFEVQLNEWLRRLGQEAEGPRNDGYDHRANFRGWDGGRLLLQEQAQLRHDLRLSPEQGAHLLLADQQYHAWLRARWGHESLFERVSEQLAALSSQGALPLRADLYFSLYR